MAWKCPACGVAQEDDKKKCGCGFAYYEVLGVKPDVPPETVEQTYQYLLNVWKTSDTAADPQAKTKSAQRLKKINDAYAVFRHFYPAQPVVKKGIAPAQIALFSGIAIVLVIGAVIFMTSSGKEPVTSPPGASAPAQSERRAGPAPAGTSGTAAPARETAPPGVEQPSPSPDMSAEKTEAWAIETVKKSRALDRMFPVEAVIDKFTRENAAAFRPVGWIAKKAEDTAYVVSYTLTDGINTKGFYFELNTETGAIRNIATSPELQQKYGITAGQ